MAKLNELQFMHPDSELRTLLAYDNLNTGASATGTKKLMPSTVNRTIIIGLGGTGVRTVDYVKGAISNRMDPSWVNYIAFLGIDSSWTELNKTAYLAREEQLMTTLEFVNKRMGDSATYPPATRCFVPKGANLPDLSTDGANQRRLAGKIKIHDQKPGDIGMDQQIVAKIDAIKKTSFANAPLAAPGKYEVYVIGSGSGGTGSGGLLEMPALIRKALEGGTQEVSVHAIVYLPDTVTSLDPQNAERLMANGYATLKEMDYYMGMYMRPQYEEKWSYSGSGTPFLERKSSSLNEGFINIPYLVGASGAAGADPSKTARVIISEFLISTLVDMSTASGQFLTTSFLSNAKAGVSSRVFADDPQNTLELVGTGHEFPKRYAAIGFAKATVPLKRVRAYTIGQLCESAGLCPVDSATRTSMAAKGAALLPFAGRDNLVNATEGTAAAKQILAPIANLFQTIHNGSFVIGQDLAGMETDWQSIKGGTFDSRITAERVQTIREARLGAKDLEDAVREFFAQYRQNVQNYVKENGAYAFVNLYDGSFSPVNGDSGTGIKTMLEHIVAGKTLDGNAVSWLSPELAQKNLEGVRSKINNIGTISFARINAGTAAAQWVTAYENLQKAKINESRRNLALGPNGYLAKYFQLPAALLRDQLLCFGGLLETLSGVYDDLGSPMQSPAAFQSARDNETEVNIASVDGSAYNWLVSQTKATVAAVNAKALRDTIVEDFFQNVDVWLNIPDGYIDKSAESGYVLTNKDLPIPARKRFEELMDQLCPDTINVSIANIFNELNTNNISFANTANKIVAQLAAVGQPLINAALPANSTHKYIVYPSSLASSLNGAQIVAALNQAVAAQWPGNTVQTYQSDDADAICLYQLVTPWEIYCLNGLKDWEIQYESFVEADGSFLHGMSPAVTETMSAGKIPEYTEEISWKDFPPITVPNGNLRLKDARGNLSREGNLLLELDALIEKAKALGVLYAEATPSGFIVKRASCDKSIDWTLDPVALLAANSGVLPQGKDFMSSLAVQNGTTLDNISRTVKLEGNGGVLDRAMPTDVLAWKYAAKTLRVHVPMFIEVRNTASLVETLFAQAQGAYQAQLQTLRQEPAIMAEMIKSGTFFCDDKGVWNYVNQYGLPVFVANPDFSAQLQPNVKTLLDNNLLAFYLFSELKNVMNGQQDSFAAAHERTQDAYRQLVATGDLAKAQANQALLQQLQQEIGLIAGKGARISNPQEPAGSNPRLDALLNAVDTNDRYAAELFYYRLNQART